MFHKWAKVKSVERLFTSQVDTWMHYPRLNKFYGSRLFSLSCREQLLTTKIMSTCFCLKPFSAQISCFGLRAMFTNNLQILIEITHGWHVQIVSFENCKWQFFFNYPPPEKKYKKIIFTVNLLGEHFMEKNEIHWHGNIFIRHGKLEKHAATRRSFILQ